MYFLYHLEICEKTPKFCRVTNYFKDDRGTFYTYFRIEGTLTIVIYLCIEFYEMIGSCEERKLMHRQSLKPSGIRINVLAS